MNAEQIRKFVQENVSYLDWEFHIGLKGETIFLQIRFMAPNNHRPDQLEAQHCRKWQLSEWMTPTEIVQTAWAAVERAVLHEASEQFKYKGKDIFNRHMNVEGLAELRDDAKALEHRAPPVLV